MKEIDNKSVESSELVEQTFKYWFNDHEHIRSPFPNYIHTQLKVDATGKFFKWAQGINPKAKEELNDEMVGEKFEEIIFETASSLVKTEDERITILYPFLPRIGDEILNEEKEKNTVFDRSLAKEDDDSYLKVKLKSNKTNKRWETKFKLPV